MNVSRLNSHYWNQLCGSRAARKLGISTGDPNGVALFDEWFFAFYPYVADDRFIPWSALGSASVLEIGLGYGSVTRRLGSVAKSVVACDISPGPVGFALATTSRVAAAQASALDLPFCSESFDVVISLGCLHHTGDLHRSLRECLRVVKPGGLMVVMVYNRYSYKRWIVAPLNTWQSWRQEAGAGLLPREHRPPAGCHGFGTVARRARLHPTLSLPRVIHCKQNFLTSQISKQTWSMLTMLMTFCQ